MTEWRKTTGNIQEQLVHSQFLYSKKREKCSRHTTRYSGTSSIKCRKNTQREVGDHDQMDLEIARPGGSGGEHCCISNSDFVIRFAQLLIQLRDIAQPCLLLPSSRCRHSSAATTNLEIGVKIYRGYPERKVEEGRIKYPIQMKLL